MRRAVATSDRHFSLLLDLELLLLRCCFTPYHWCKRNAIAGISLSLPLSLSLSLFPSLFNLSRYPESITERSMYDMDISSGDGLTHLYYSKGDELWPFGFGLSCAPSISLPLSRSLTLSLSLSLSLTLSSAPPPPPPRARMCLRPPLALRYNLFQYPSAIGHKGKCLLVLHRHDIQLHMVGIDLVPDRLSSGNATHHRCPPPTHTLKH